MFKKKKQQLGTMDIWGIRKQKGGKRVAPIFSLTHPVRPSSRKQVFGFIPMTPSPLFRKESILQKHLSPWGDADLDGSPNKWDCNPWDVRKDKKKGKVNLSPNAFRAEEGHGSQFSRGQKRTRSGPAAQRLNREIVYGGAIGAIAKYQTGKKIESYSESARKKGEAQFARLSKLYAAKYSSQAGKISDYATIEQRAAESKKRAIQNLAAKRRRLMEQRVEEPVMTEQQRENIKRKIEEKLVRAQRGKITKEARSKIASIPRQRELAIGRIERKAQREKEAAERLSKLKEFKTRVGIEKTAVQKEEDEAAERRKWILQGGLEGRRRLAKMDYEKKESKATVVKQGISNAESMIESNQKELNKLRKELDNPIGMTNAKRNELQRLIQLKEGEAKSKQGELLGLIETAKTVPGASKEEQERLHKLEMESRLVVRTRKGLRSIAGPGLLTGGVVSETGEYTKEAKLKSKRIKRLVQGAASTLFGANILQTSGVIRERGRPRGPSGRYTLSDKPVYEQEFQDYKAKQRALNRMTPSTQQQAPMSQDYIQQMQAQQLATQAQQPQYGTPQENGVQSALQQIQQQQTEGQSLDYTGDEMQQPEQPQMRQQLSADDIKAAQHLAQQQDNILNAPEFSKGELHLQENLLTPKGPQIIDAAQIFKGELRTMQKNDASEIHLSERPQTNPAGDIYLDIELGSGKPVIKKRPSEKWMTGEAL